jgi:diguanylate cyclase (GGDEF)-like protein/PAS domain S-box-containing protein
LVGRSVFTLIDPDSLAHARVRTAGLTAPGGRAEQVELTYLRLDGTPFAVEAAAAAVLLDGRLVVQVVFRDITKRKQAEVALQARTAELETMMETVPVGVWLAHDAAARRITGNRHAAELLRLRQADNLSLSAPTEQRPSNFRVLKDGRELRAEELPLQRAARGEMVRNEELRIAFNDGSFIDELVSATPIRDAKGAITGAVGAAVDISERKAAEERVRHVALHDALTGLPNRTLFRERLAQALSLARRRGERVGVVLLDLDQFKEVNDTLGHSAGDALLCEVSRRLRDVARASDTWARLGGDEFALVQEGLDEVDSAPRLARRVLAAFREPFRIEEQEVDIGVSLGLTLFPDDGETPEVLLRNADVALYRAKAAGRGRFEPYRTELDRDLRERRRLQRGLRHALEEKALELVYQPIFELVGESLTKVEALVRWRQSGGDVASPAAFIPIAESSGLIHPLGGWILRTACQQATAWRALGQRVKMAVNVSAAQLRQPGFPKLVREALRTTGLEPQLLELELTESVFLDPAKEQIHDTLRQLTELGVTLAIDDFGTGYSSLAYLKHFPFDEVKLDRMFVADIGRGSTAGSMAAAVVNLAHSLGKRVTAEGVETTEQLTFLREQGCDAAQGFLLGRPGPADRVIRLLAKAA